MSQHRNNELHEYPAENLLYFICHPVRLSCPYGGHLPVYGPGGDCHFICPAYYSLDISTEEFTEGVMVLDQDVTGWLTI